MKAILFSMLLSLASNLLFAQDQEVVSWLNANAIEITETEKGSALQAFQQQAPKKFLQAKVWGFGEATHHSKEFFELKAKFFQYLVEKQQVRAFLMEESYPAEKAINEWISGGKGDIHAVVKSFSITTWQCQEVANLLLWMRKYNQERPKQEHIRFFGLDIQTIEGINKDLRAAVSAMGLEVNEQLLLAADSCANQQFMYQRPPQNWSERQLPSLKEISSIVNEAKKGASPEKLHVFNNMIRILNTLMHYTLYVQSPHSSIRDQAMFENAKFILENEAVGGKAFVWAHNNHINNKELPPYGSNWTSMGGHLKAYYKEKYYSVGFDFGGGIVPSYDAKNYRYNYLEIKKPFKKTYAATLNQANSNCYFIDITEATESSIAPFFQEKKKQFILGGPGFVSKMRSLPLIEYAESYDGLIFVKTVSMPQYNLSDDQ